MANRKSLKAKEIWFLVVFSVITLATFNVYAANSWRDAQTFADLPSSVDLTTMSLEEIDQLTDRIISLIDAELTRSSDRKYDYFVSINEEEGVVRIDFFPLIDGLCGNSVCDAGEDFMNCLTDCPTSNCGNSVCDAGETSISCPPDCGMVTNNYPSTDTPYTIPSNYDAYGNSIPTTTTDTPYTIPTTEQSTAPTTYNNPVYSTGYKAPPNPMNCGNGICDLGDSATMPEDSYSCPTDCSQQSNPLTGMVVGNLLTGFAVQDPSACSDQCNKLAEATGHNPNNPKIKKCYGRGNICCKVDEDCVYAPRTETNLCCPRGTGRIGPTGLAYCKPEKEDCKRNGWPEGGVLPNSGNTECGGVVKCCGPDYKCNVNVFIPNVCVPRGGWFSDPPCPNTVCNNICCPSANDVCVTLTLPSDSEDPTVMSACSAVNNACSSGRGAVCGGTQRYSPLQACCPLGYNCANQPDGQPRCLKST